MKNIVLFIALFFCEAIPAFIVSKHIYSDYIVGYLAVSLLAASLAFSWFFADKNNKLIKNLGYTGMLTGIASSVSYFTNYGSSTGILIVSMSMIVGINISLRERRMLTYLLLFSFMLFLYASSIVFNEYSILSIVLFTFSFFTAVIADYYNSRIQLQSTHISNSTNSFFSTTIILVIVVSIFTAILYYLIPQPKAIHYGILPFGAKKHYKGIPGEEYEKSKLYKDHITKLPKYTVDGKKTNKNDNILTFNKKIPEKNNVNKIYSGKEKTAIKLKHASTEKFLKRKNKKAYYSNISSGVTSKQNDILFEVKGKQARFLRGNTYASFNGKSWKKVLTKMYTYKNGSRDYYNYWNGKEWKKRTRSYKNNDFYYNEYFTKKSDNYTITVKSKLAGKPIIYRPAGLLRLQFPSDTFYEDASRVIYAPSQLEVGTYYTACVENESYYGYDAMSYEDVWYKKAYSKIGNKLDKRVSKLAQKLTKDWDNSFEKAQAIVNYFKMNYTYKHSSIDHSIQNQTLSEMLFKTKMGNALQFNTALIMMLRASGEYARLVTGYAPDEYNQNTNSYLIHRNNKAVWTEVFVSKRGWVSIHAADDIPFEGENIEIEIYNSELYEVILYILIFLIILLTPIAYYYARKYIWIYLSKKKIEKYYKKNNINFVILTFKEVEQLYSKFNKGKVESHTLQEYEKYIKEIKPESAYLIEYIIFYSNQAIYKNELDLDFDKNRYLEIALYLIDKPFNLEPISKYIVDNIKNLIK